MEGAPRRLLKLSRSLNSVSVSLAPRKTLEMPDRSAGAGGALLPPCPGRLAGCPEGRPEPGPGCAGWVGSLR